MRTVLYVNDAVAIGGGERNLLSWIHALGGSDWTPLVTCPTDGAFPALLRECGIPVEFVKLPEWRKLKDVPRGLLAWLSLNRIVKRHGVALIHANSPPWFPVACLVARHQGLPCAVSVQSRLRPRRVKQFLLHRSDVILTVSASLRTLMEESGVPRGRTRTIYSTVDTEHFSPIAKSGDVRHRFGIPDEAPLIGCVANVAHYKGQDILLEAFPTILKEMPDTHCLFVGRDTEEFAVRLKVAVQRMGLGERVHFAGFHADVRHWVGAVDLVVLPSRVEGMPVALLEAMAMAKPLIASAVDGTPEIIEDGETGLLVPPENADAVMAAVVSLLQDPARRQAFGEAGRRKAENFSVGRARDTLLQAYEEAVAAKRGIGH